MKFPDMKNPDSTGRLEGAALAGPDGNRAGITGAAR